jgi:hypothetical protein
MKLLVALIVLVISIIIIFFKSDILDKDTSLNKLSGTSGFVVCVVALVIIYIINRV